MSVELVALLSVAVGFIVGLFVGVGGLFWLAKLADAGLEADYQRNED